MTHFRGSRAACLHLSNDVRHRSRRRLVGLSSLRSPTGRLLEVVKPWLIVGAFLLILGLAGGIESGAVWP
jgi:hypothetical protein